MTRTKLFYGNGDKSIDEQINEFLDVKGVTLLDVKFISVDNTYSTQCNYMALLIYR